MKDKEYIEALEAALEVIANRAGNLSDEVLESRTGSNDAVARGIMVTSMRAIAREALKLKNNE